jgi:hypothetical protein
MAQAKLTFNGTEYNVPCSGISVSGQKNVDIKPNANIDGPVEAQTMAFENLSFNIQGVRYTGTAGDLTYAALLSMYRHKYSGPAASGTNGPITLEVSYGPARVTGGTETDLVGSDGVTTSIKVVVKSFTFPLNTQDSTNAYLPVGNITLVETA